MTTRAMIHHKPFTRSRRRPAHRRLAVEPLEGRSLLTSVATSLSVAVSNTTLFSSQSETITATISVASGIAAPNGGTITFFDNGNELGTAVVSNGTASYATSTLSLGSNAFTAAYGGFTGSGGTVYESSVATGTQSYLLASGLSSVSGVAVDQAGDIFVADSINNDVIEVSATGTQSTVATGLNGPRGLAVDTRGDLFIADANNDRIVEVKPLAQPTIFASGLSTPQGVAVDAAGDVFIADSGKNEVLELTIGGKQLTIGTGLSNPESVAVDAAGDVFIADTGNSRLVEVPAGQPQKTVAYGISAYGLAVDSMGNLFIAAGHQVAELTPQNTQSTFDTNIGFASSVAVDNLGNVIIGDSENINVPIVAEGVPATVSPIPTSTTLTVSSPSPVFGQTETLTATVNVPSDLTDPSAGTVTFYDGSTSIGQSTVSGGVATFTTSTLALGSHAITAKYGGAIGYAASASGIQPGAGQSVVAVSGLSKPAGVAVDNMGGLFISDLNNNVVVKLTQSGTQTNFFSTLSEPIGLAVDAAGDVFIADSKNSRVVEVSSSGKQTIIASGLSFPEGVAVDGTGDVFIADTGHGQVVEVNSTGSHPIGDCCFIDPTGLAVDAAGDLFIADTAQPLGQTSLIGTVYEVTKSGIMTTVATGLGEVQDVAADSAGNLYVSEPLINEVLEITPSGAQFTVGSNLSGPAGLAIDGAGDLFVTDAAGDQVLKLTPGVSVTVNPDPTSTSVAVNTASILLGQPVTFTATISVPGGATAPNAGTVTFFEGTNKLGSAPVTAGAATFTTSGLPLGTDLVTASYSGTPGFNASTSGIEAISEQSVVSGSGLSDLAGVAVDAEGDIFIAYSRNNRVVEEMTDGTQMNIGSGLTDPLGVAVDRNGNVFIADTGNGRVVEVPTSGPQKTIISGLNNPVGVAVNAADDVFIAGVIDSPVIEVTPSGTQSSLGSLDAASAVALDQAGDLFAAYPDEEVVTELTPSGTQTTVLSGVISLGDLAVDANGDIFTGGFGSNQILVSTPAETQFTIGSGLSSPSSLAADAAGDLFISDSGNNRIVKLTGVPVTVSATPTSISLAESAASTRFGGPDTFTARISVPSGSTPPSAGTVTFFVGTTEFGTAPVTVGVATLTTSSLPLGADTITASYSGAAGYLASKSGVEPTSMQSVVPFSGLTIPLGLAVDNQGDVFVSEYGNNEVLEITQSGVQSVVGSGLKIPAGLAVGSAGDLFIADSGNNRIYEVPVSGPPKTVYSNLTTPTGVAVDSAGDLFIAEVNNPSLIELINGITPTTIGSGFGDPYDVAVDVAGDAFVADIDNDDVVKITPLGVQTNVASGLNSAQGIAVDGAGDVFVSEIGQVLEITPSGNQKNIGSGLAAPSAVAVDAAGDLFIADQDLHEVLKITAGLSVTVTQGMPTLSWTKPADITYGTPLGTNQLDAMSNVPGTFAYTPLLGTTLPMGQSETLSVTFTPTDTTDYASVTTTTTINIVSRPPVIVSEQPLFERKLKHGKPTGKPVLVGYMIDFSTKLNASSANQTSNYVVDALNVKKVKKQKVTSLQPLTNFTVSYNDASDSVSLVFNNPPTFKTGGEITILGGPANGVTGPNGTFVSGNRVLMISAGGKSITLA